MENTEVMLISTSGGAARAAIETTGDILLCSMRTNGVANATLTYPANPRPFQSFWVATRHAITTITTQSSGRTVDKPLTSLPAGGGFAHWVFIPEENTWLRVG